MEEEENLKAECNDGGKNLGREERYRTAISGMEPRRIAEVMLLPRTALPTLQVSACDFACQYEETL